MADSFDEDREMIFEDLKWDDKDRAAKMKRFSDGLMRELELASFVQELNTYCDGCNKVIETLLARIRRLKTGTNLESE